MKTQALFVTLLTIFSLFFASNQVLALDVPTFPTCSSPQGEVKVSYPEGTHGIPGDGTTYSGSDTVYQLDNGNLQQCFCSVNGQGIQTNWWRDSSLTSEERQILINSGWIYVPNGTLWGLDEIAYMAYNSTYSCLTANPTPPPSVGDGGGSGSGDGLNDGLGCASHDCSNQGGVLGASTEPQVLGISTSIGDVLGLASTGGNFIPFILAIVGTIVLSAGLVLNKKSSQK